MDVFVISYDADGRELQKKIYDYLLSKNMETILFSDLGENEEEIPYSNNLIRKIGTKMYGIIDYAFKNLKVVIFISDISSAITNIAPFVANSKEDSRPAVLVIDKKERFIVPILSSTKIDSVKFPIGLSNYIETTPILTENDKEVIFSSIEWCRENKFNMVNVRFLKEIYHKLLRKEEVPIYSEFEIQGEIPANLKLITEEERIRYDMDCEDGDCPYEYGIYICRNSQTRVSLPFKNILILEAKEYILGIGCKKNVTHEMLLKAIHYSKIDMNKICAISTSTGLADELAIQRLAKELKVDIHSFSENELLALNSTAYKPATAAGIMNICERSANTLSFLIEHNKWDLKFKNKNLRALLNSRNISYTGDYFLKKTPYLGVNLSIVKRRIKINLYNF